MLTRAGHTEAGVDLAMLAGLEPAGVLVEILNPDGSMARRPELEVFAREHGLKMGSIADLIAYRLATEKTVERVDEREIDTEFGPFKLVTYRDRIAHDLHFALVRGTPDAETPTLVRVQVENPLADLLHWRRDDFGVAATDALRAIDAGSAGVMVVLSARAMAKPCWPACASSRRRWCRSRTRTWASGAATVPARDPVRPGPGQAARAGHPAPPGWPGRLRPGSGGDGHPVMGLPASGRHYRWVPAVGRQPVAASHGRGPSTLNYPPSSSLPHMSHYEGDLRTPESARAILASRWNARITDTLVAGARQSLAGNGITEANIDVIRVPGAWELPLVAARLAAAHEHAAILTLGCVIRGDTRHYEHVADRCAEA